MPAQDTAKDLSALRQKVLREVKKLLKPHLRESGFRQAIDRTKGVAGNSRPLLLWMPLDKDGKATCRSWLLDGFVVGELFGFTEDGVITEAKYMIETTYWQSVPVEDLVRLRAWLVKHLPAAAI